jgi:hypothetical protein
MSESNLATREVREGASIACTPRRSPSSPSAVRELSDAETNALLENGAKRSRRRLRPAVFEDSGAALFRPFRIY